MLIRSPIAQKMAGRRYARTIMKRFTPQAVGDAGQIEGYGSMFKVLDDWGTVTMPGCFTDSLQRHAEAGTLPKMLWQHDQTQPVGAWSEVVEDDTGLRTFTGLANYNTILNDPQWSASFWNAMANNLKFFAIHMLVQNPISLLLAAPVALRGLLRATLAPARAQKAALAVRIVPSGLNSMTAKDFESASKVRWASAWL